MHAEVTRLRFRRRVGLSVLAMVLLGLLLPTFLMPTQGPLTQQEVAEAREFLAQARADGCTECTLSDMMRTPWTFDDVVTTLSDTGLLWGLVVFMIVLTYVGSDFSSGTLATQLTFTPRRPLVLAARCLAGGLMGGALFLIGMLTVTVVSTVWFLALYGFGSIGPAAGLLDLLTMSALYGVLLGLIASLLVFVCNGSAAAASMAILAVVLGGVVELVVWERGTLWLIHLSPSLQGIALMEGSAEHYGSFEGAAPVVVGRPEALGFHLVVIAVLAVLASVAFERRDVKG